jgi:chemotaxis signal transduction protein
VVNLFAEARTAFRESHKEISIVLIDGRKHLSVTVDSVESAEAIAEETIEDAAPALGSGKSDLIRKVAHRANDKGIVFLLDAEALLAGHC